MKLAQLIIFALGKYVTRNRPPKIPPFLIELHIDGNMFVLVHTNRVGCMIIWADRHTIHACYRWHSCYN